MTTATNPHPVPDVPLPDVPLPDGFTAPYDWEPGRIVSRDENRAWRCIDGNARTISDHAVHVQLRAIQYEDGSLDDPGIDVHTGDDKLNSDQARELAASLLEAAAELDRLLAR